MRRCLRPLGMLPLLAAAVASGCDKEKTFDPPDREARLADAEARFAAVRFDTLTWESDDTRARDGNAVYAAQCRDCHGTLGRGETEYADSRGIEVPSLVRPDWSLAGDLDAVRRVVFVGHASGMPTWGVAGISHREIDAVAFYVLRRLRPEILDGP